MKYGKSRYIPPKKRSNRKKVCPSKRGRRSQNKAGEVEVDDVLVWVIENLVSWRVEMPLYLSTDEESFIGYIDEKMEGVMSELKMILDFLRDNIKVVEPSSSSSKRLNYLICDVVHMAYDALLFNEIDDRETFQYQVDLYLRWLREVKSRLFKLGSDGADEEEDEEEPNKRLLKYINVGDKEYVVGLEKHVQFLLGKEILNEKKRNSTLIIRGVVGSGKTTLARQLYNHKDVVDKFECRAWVCVSNDLTLKQLLMQLVQQVVDIEDIESGALLEELEHADNISLQEMLQQHLQGKRFFIVLDDLRRQMSLELIHGYLPSEDNGSRVLLTIRIDDAQQYQRRFYRIHNMSYLDSDESWELFLKTISCNNELTSDQKFPKKLQRRGKSMLRKCGGLPLAIKVVGRQSVERRQSGTEWEEIIESFDLGPVVELLEPSYQRFDPTMKTCFLHFSFFKENASIKADRFIQILHAGSEVLKTDEINGALYMLRHRELIIERKYSHVWSKFKSCRINSLFHSLSIKKAEEEIGLEIVRNNGIYQPSRRPRHRVITNYSRDEFSYSMNQDHRHIVSLFFHGGGYFDDSSSYWETLEQLRILDLDGYGIKVLPEAIGTPIELRYLGLRNNYIRELPSSLRCLINLETVDIAQNYMMEVPDIIWEMYSLHHIYMSDIICRRPLKIDTLKYLKSLIYISLNNWAFDKWRLRMMTELEKLGIEELDVNSDVNKLFTSLAMLRKLRTLILRGFRFKSMPCLDKLRVLQFLRTLKLGGVLPRLPSVDNFPPGIEYLKLYDSCLVEDPMPILERLPNLMSLKLRNAYTGKEMVISYRGFRYLEHLHIEELWNLRHVHIDKDHMTMFRLRQFKIKKCPNLKTLKDMHFRVKNKVVIKM